MATIHDVLVRPRVTEKANYQVGSFNQYVFEVSRDATKTLIKDAIETLFNVTVMNVNVINAILGIIVLNKRLIGSRIHYGCFIIIYCE